MTKLPSPRLEDHDCRDWSDYVFCASYALFIVLVALAILCLCSAIR